MARSEGPAPNGSTATRGSASVTMPDDRVGILLQLRSVQFPIMSQPSPLPPFSRDDAFAVAYVRGRDNRSESEAFLILSILRWDRRTAFGFQIVGLDGSLLRFRKMALRGVSIEHALIHALILFDVPLAQWRPYPDPELHRAELSSAKLYRRYCRARRDLLATLHRARLDLYFGFEGRNSEFQVECRSETEMRDDLEEKRLILLAVNTRGPAAL